MGVDMKAMVLQGYGLGENSRRVQKGIVTHNEITPAQARPEYLAAHLVS
jgi:hypothetical protein